MSKVSNALGTTCIATVPKGSAVATVATELVQYDTKLVKYSSSMLVATSVCKEQGLIPIPKSVDLWQYFGRIFSKRTVSQAAKGLDRSPGSLPFWSPFHGPAIGKGRGGDQVDNKEGHGRGAQ